MGYGRRLANWDWNIDGQFLYHASVVLQWVADFVGNLLSDADNMAPLSHSLALVYLDGQH